MSAAILARGLAEHRRGMLVTAGSVGAMLFLGLYMYQGIDLSFYDALPEAVRSLLGVPPHADASVMAYNEMLASIGALAFTGVAVAMGAGCVAADETAGRVSLILSAPVSRTRLALSRAAALVLSLVASGVLLWGIAEVAPLILGIETGDAHLLALMVHLVANALFHGALAFAVATATGRRSLGAGVAATVLVGGWLANGLLPIWKQGAADWVPWHWFNGSLPLVGGLDARDVALLLCGALAFFALGVLGFARRELRTAAVGPGVVDRLRSIPGVGGLLRPTGRGASLLAIRVAAQKVLVSYVTLLLALGMGLAMPPMYVGLADALADFGMSFPQSMVDMFGGGNLDTAAGFLHLETFGMIAPICIILVVTTAAASGIAGEERAGRMSVLLAQPLSRARVYLTVALTAALYSAVVAGALFLGVWGGVALSGVDVSVVNLAWACLLLLLLGWFFGALALLLSSATGRPSVAVWGTTAVAVASYFGYTLLLAAGRTEWGLWSPFAPYLYGPALMQGIEWWQPVWLGAGTLALLLIGLALWRHRDLAPVRG
ncbi:ABC-2 family transporter protein [Tessaracoccus bendigoensis DSM 12906]|uniref:ABC-2 family transporter protein n=1 Tax=Tessaracoccus bendigoensis DSM 12906 TaxID=1123357 RepID=A0A1M6FDG0_9ACTN|nr:ABC transporter permease subunit [Tessaracoccus bendigoensis]SHI95702.1 ABC-2 family transporter protein [Tessaracoccus bendigoensis DSM 12906]